MKWFKNRSTTTKLLIAFGGIAFLAAAVGYQGVHGMGGIHELATVNYEQHALGVDDIQEARNQVLHMSRGVRDAIIDVAFNDQKALRTRVESYKKRQATYEQHIEDFKKRIVTAEVKTESAELERLVKKMIANDERTMELAKLNKGPEARAALVETLAATVQAEDQMKKVVAMKLEVMRKATEAADAVFSRSRLFVVALIAGAVALAIGVGLLVARLIARPLEQAGEVLEGVAAGDFTRRLDLDTTDEIGRMATALNQAVDSMRGALLEVSKSANHAASASVQLSRGVGAALVRRAGAGVEPGGDRGLAGGDHRHGEAERRQRPAGQPAREARGTWRRRAGRWWRRRSTR